MRVELISIGNELLTGKTVNTNVAFIGSRLLAQGFIITKQTMISDSAPTIFTALEEALSHNDITIVTGGLGPTLDDITRQTAAAATNCSMALNETVAAHLKKRYGRLVDDQAIIPEKATPLLNDVGSAPGLLFEQERRLLILLPGVPLEMQELLEAQVLPLLQKKFPQTLRPFIFSVHMHSMREADVDPLLRKLQKENPSIEYGIYPDMGLVTVRLLVSAKTFSEAEEMTKSPLEAIKTAFSDCIFDADTIEEAIHNLFIEKKLTLSAAESCTGGAISSSLLRLPGASSYFLGSIIAYSYEIKTDLLGVPKELLDRCGAVSAEVVESMVRGILERTSSSYAIAVSGIAGPAGGTPDKPVGTVWCAIGTPSSIKTWKLQLKGNRDSIIRITAHKVLGELYNIVKI